MALPVSAYKKTESTFSPILAVPTREDHLWRTYDSSAVLHLACPLGHFEPAPSPWFVYSRRKGPTVRRCLDHMSALHSRICTCYRNDPFHVFMLFHGPDIDEIRPCLGKTGTAHEEQPGRSNSDAQSRRESVATRISRNKRDATEKVAPKRAEEGTATKR